MSNSGRRGREKAPKGGLPSTKTACPKRLTAVSRMSGRALPAVWSGTKTLTLNSRVKYDKRLIQERLKGFGRDRVED